MGEDLSECEEVGWMNISELKERKELAERERVVGKAGGLGDYVGTTDVDYVGYEDHASFLIL